MTKNCLTCGKVFYTKPSIIKRGRGKFCSQKCCSVAITTKIKRICQICKKVFYTEPSRIKKGCGKFCSLKCRGIWQSQSQRGKNSHYWKGGGVARICQICGKEFYVGLSNIKNGYSKFCSRKCFYISRPAKVNRNCGICGKEFFIVPSRIRKGEGKFCSLKCVGISNSKSMKGKSKPMLQGKLNHNWKGGITSIRKKIRASILCQEWRQEIFIRDNFTCQQCGQIGGKLEAHHIKPFHKLIEEVKKYLPLLNLYDGAMIYTLLWNLDNGITLCKKCHSKINTRK